MSRPTLVRALDHARAAAGGMAPLTDDVLLARFVADRDEGAFSELVRRYGPLVRGVARRRLADAHEADDVAQATFLALARQAGRLNRARPLAGWLFTVAHRTACKAQVRSARRPGPLQDDQAVAADPLAVLSARELVAALDDELARLPERYRMPVVLCAMEGFSRDEAANRLGWTLGSLCGRLERGRQLLRRRLAARGLTVPAVLAGGSVAVPAEALPPALVRAIARAAVTLAPAATTSKLFAVAVIVLTALGIGTAAVINSAGRPGPNAPSLTSDRAAGLAIRTDAHGDPLPDGAIVRLGTTRLRHPGTFSIALSPDNKLVSFDRDYVVRVWDPVTGRLLRERAFKKEPVHRWWGGRLSADTRRLAMQVGDRVKVFEVESGKEIAVANHASALDAYAGFSPNGRQLAIVDQDGKGTCKLQVCDVDSNTCREIAAVPSFFSEPVFSRDGRRLALPMSSSGVTVWDMPTGHVAARFQSEGLSAGTVDFDASGDVLAILGTRPNQFFHFFQISNGQTADTWIAPPVGEVNWSRFAADGSTLLLGDDFAIRWYDPKTGKMVRSIPGKAWLRPALSTDGRLIASARGNMFDVWDAKTGQSIIPPDLAGLEEEVHGVTVSPDGKWIVTVGERGTIRIWTVDGRLKSTIASNEWTGRYSIFSPDGRSLYCGAPDAIALVRRDFPGGAETARYQFDEPAADHLSIGKVGLSADGRRLAAFTQTIHRNPALDRQGLGGASIALTVWDTATGKRIESREVGPRESMLGYGAYAPNLQWYFMGNRPISVHGGTEFRLELPKGWVKQAAVSPDGLLVAHVVEQAIRDAKGNAIDFKSPGVLVHETLTGKHVLTVPADLCGAIAFTPDNRGLIVTDPAGITRWDMVTRKSVVQHKAPGRFRGSYGWSFASGLAVTPDGAGAVTGHIDTTTLVWSLPPPPPRQTTLNESERSSAWADLAGEDAGKAYAAIWALADAGGETVAFLRERLRPVALPSQDRLVDLIARLDAPEIGVRDAAEKELDAISELAAPFLRERLKANLTTEQANGIKRVLAAAQKPVLPPGDRLRQLRAVTVLEESGSPDARQLLAEIAAGAKGANLSSAATDALSRLGAR